MSFTGQNIMTSAAARAHKDLTDTDADTDVKEWVKQAILYLQKIDDFQCHKTTFALTTASTPALTALTYAYNMRTLVTRFRKLAGNSVRVGSHMIEWMESPEDIDAELGQDWKDGSQSGVPDYCTLVSHNLWLAPAPSSSFVTTYTGSTSGVRGYCYVGEDVTTTNWEDVALLFSDDFYMDLVDLALIFATQVEDDDNFRTLLQQWEQAGLNRVRGYDEVPLTNERIKGPRRRMAV